MALKVLIADDQIASRRLFEMVLAREGYDVMTVDSGAAALEKVRQKRPDIALIDAMMPEMDGYQVCETLKKNPHFKNLPMILLAGTYEGFDQERGVKIVGAQSILNKPPKPADILAKVKEMLSAAASKPVVAKDVARLAAEVIPEPPVVQEEYEFDEESEEADLVVESEILDEEAELELAHETEVGEAAEDFEDNAEMLEEIEPAAEMEEMGEDDRASEEIAEAEIEDTDEDIFADVEEVAEAADVADEVAEAEPEDSADLYDELTDDEMVESAAQEPEIAETDDEDMTDLYAEVTEAETAESAEPEPEIAATEAEDMTDLYAEVAEAEETAEVVTPLLAEPEVAEVRETFVETVKAPEIAQFVNVTEPEAAAAFPIDAENLDMLADALAQRLAERFLPMLMQQMGKYLLHFPMVKEMVQAASKELIKDVLPEMQKRK